MMSKTDTADSSTDPDPDEYPEAETLFQQRILFILAGYETGRYEDRNHAGSEAYGLGIKRTLEQKIGQEVSHGRLYTNLDTLVEKGMVEKQAIDKRTNGYEITDDGWHYLREEVQWMLGCIDLDIEHGDDEDAVEVDPEIKRAVTAHEYLADVADELDLTVGRARAPLVGCGLYGEVQEGSR